MIKIAEQTYKLANRKGVLNVYLTWCKLKSYNSQGTIKRESTEIEKVASFISISTPTLRTHLTKLVKLGLVKRNKYSYSLVSYDRCWEILGLDLSPSKSKTKTRKGSFIIFKIEDRENLKEKIELSEIVISTQRQAFQARKSILKQSKYFTDTEKNALRKCRFIDLPQHLDDLYVSRLSVLTNVERFLDDIDLAKFQELQGRDHYFTKITPYLTCERTSIVLGYEPNPRTGQLVRKRIEQARLARFETRDVQFLDTRSWSNSVKGFELIQRSPNRVKETGTKLTHRLISRMIIQ